MGFHDYPNLHSAIKISLMFSKPDHGEHQRVSRPISPQLDGTENRCFASSWKKYAFPARATRAPVKRRNPTGRPAPQRRLNAAPR
jgi:hypothetical protein